MKKRKYSREELKAARKRSVIALSAVVVLVVAAGVLLGPWGPLKGHLYREGSGNTGHVSKKKGSDGQLTSGASNENRYYWVAPKLDELEAKKSVTEPPTVAIVVDDVGYSMDPMPLWTAIDAPLNFSVMPLLGNSSKAALRLHMAGYQVMMHIPTENAPPNAYSGKGQLSVGMDRNTVFSTLDADAATIPFVAGINNHQGSRGCDDSPLMTYMCEWAKGKGFYVVDSNSSNNSMVTAACLTLGMPKRRNQVFIDHQNEPEYIRGAMRRLAELARQNGTAIGICHWHRPNTPTVVGEMVKQLKKEGVHFAFVKDITN